MPIILQRTKRHIKRRGRAPVVQSLAGMSRKQLEGLAIGHGLTRRVLRWKDETIIAKLVGLGYSA